MITAILIMHMAWNHHEHMLYFLVLIKVVDPSHETEGHLFMKERDYTVRELSPMFCRIGTLMLTMEGSEYEEEREKTPYPVVVHSCLVCFASLSGCCLR